MMNEMHELNRKGWDVMSPYWQAKVNATEDWRKCHIDPTLALKQQELKYLGNISGKDACVLGSGNNLVAFTLAGLGAKVTSVDISEKQLGIAGERAKELGLNINFIHADVTDLSPISDETFELVYTGGHVAVWVSDLKRFYGEAGRILKADGMFMVNEYHPFRRIWKELPDRLEIESGYFERGPHLKDFSKEIPDAQVGPLPIYVFHWTVSDYVMAMINAGCKLVALDEIGDQLQVWEWETAPLKGLPESLLMVGRKR